mmetsp:Transcript_19464/g.27386  ORF Transcript_19464/g.27386 Transcript_19464/m.27386 type:complete len:339 (-) Transcript_19464:125-1141(-)
MYSQLNDDIPKDSNNTPNERNNNENTTKSPKKKGIHLEKKGNKSSRGNHSTSQLRESLIPEDAGNDHETTSDLEMGRERQTNDQNGASSSSLMKSDDDPFYVFREDLLEKLDSMEDALESYTLMVHDTDTAVNKNGLRESKKHLKKQIKNAESTLKDLQTTVRLVESKRDKFDNIDDSELEDRKIFVSSSIDRIKGVKKGMVSDDLKAKMQQDEKAKTRRRLGIMGAQNDAEKQNTDLIEDTHASAQLMMHQQDETLDELDEAVTRVGTIAGTINEELGQQNKMLDELEEDLKDVEENLGIVMGKLAKVLKTKNKCQLGIIICLMATVVILVFLIVYF